MAYQLVLPISVLLTILFVGWVIGPDSLDELRQGAGDLDTFGPLWLWAVRSVVLLGVGVAIAAGLYTLFVEGAIVPPI